MSSDSHLWKRSNIQTREAGVCYVSLVMSKYWNYTYDSPSLKLKFQTVLTLTEIGAL